MNQSSIGWIALAIAVFVYLDLLFVELRRIGREGKRILTRVIAYGDLPVIAQAERAGDDADPHLMAHLGAVHAALWSSRVVLTDAAARIDREPASDLFVTATSARTVVERDSVEVINRVGRALGPGPLAHDAGHAAAVFDLTVYLRQHHGERDLADLGRRVAAGEPQAPW